MSIIPQMQLFIRELNLVPTLFQTKNLMPLPMQHFAQNIFISGELEDNVLPNTPSLLANFGINYKTGRKIYRFLLIQGWWENSI